MPSPTLNIIADVAGRFDELIALVAKMPSAEFLFVGDLHDRGAQSKQVIEWVMENAKCLHSNHGDMFVDYYEQGGAYVDDIFLHNGGLETLKSYDVPLSYDLRTLVKNTRAKIPKEHIEWLKTRPFYYSNNEIFVSHASRWQSIYTEKTLKSLCETGPYNSDSLLWNRTMPLSLDGKFQVYGHNGRMEKFEDYAICIDDCFSKKLTGIHWPTKEIYQVAYKD